MKTSKHGASNVAKGKHCWLKSGKKKDQCRANKYARKNQGGYLSDMNKQISALEAKTKVGDNADSVENSIFDGETFDSTREATVSMGMSMSPEAYDAKMAHDKHLSAKARLHYLENDEAAYKHPILKHYSKF